MAKKQPITIEQNSPTTAATRLYRYSKNNYQRNPGSGLYSSGFGLEAILGIILVLVSLGGYAHVPDGSDITWVEFISEYEINHQRITEGEMRVIQSRIDYDRFANGKNRNTISVDLFQARWEFRDFQSLNLRYGLAWNRESPYGGNIQILLSNTTGLSWRDGLSFPYHTQSPNITLKMNQPLYFAPVNRISFSASIARDEVILQELSLLDAKQTIYLEGLAIFSRWILGVNRYHAMKELYKIESNTLELVQTLYDLGQTTQTEVWNFQKNGVETQIRLSQSYHDLVDLLFGIKLSGAFQYLTINELLKVTPIIPQTPAMGSSPDLTHSKRIPDLKLQIYDFQLNQLEIKSRENRAKNFPILSLILGYAPQPFQAFIPSSFLESWANIKPSSWFEPFHVSMAFQFSPGKPDTLKQKAEIANEILFLKNLRNQRVELFQIRLEQLSKRYLHAKDLYNQSLIHLDLIRKQIETLESAVQKGFQDPLILQQTLIAQMYKKMELEDLAIEIWKLTQESWILINYKN